MKKFAFYLLSITFLLMPLCTSAQADRNSIFKVAVGNMEYTPKEEKTTVGSVLGTIGKALVLGSVTTHRDKYAASVKACVLSGFSGVRRFHTTEGEFKEGEMDENIPAFNVNGTINSISTTAELFTPIDKNTKPYNVYKAQIEVTVHVKDVHDGHIVDSHTFYVTYHDLGWAISEDKAISEALIRLSSKVARHYNTLFPLSASIIEAGMAKKDKQKEVYIDLGSASAARPNMRFTVFSVKDIAGRPAKRELGVIKIVEVMGDEISLCKVKSGGKNIKAALEEGEDVVVMSYE
ncbi:MAG: hypothetical protein IIV13_05840 [Bacteroidaceae bacterium]|nr:hypothetical protein [Bacteroidaceae bacterium]